MRVDSIAIKSLTRKKYKSLFVVFILTLTFAMVTSLYSVSSALSLQLADSFDAIGPNIIVVPQGHNTSFGGLNVPGAALDDSLDNNVVIAINTIENRENIAVVAPKVLGVLELEQKQVPVAGVDFPAELQLKRWWSYTGDKPSKVEDLLVGANVAKRLKIEPGQTLSIDGEELVVRAILDLQGNEEDDLVFMHLLTAQNLLAKPNQLSLIEVAAYCTTCPIEQIVDQIKSKLPGVKVTALAESVKARQQYVEGFQVFSKVLSFITIVIGAFLIFITMLNSVKDRTVEIGVLRSLGFRMSNVFELILTEALVLGMIGGMSAYLTGMGLAKLISGWIVQVPVPLSWGILEAGVVVILTVFLACLASLYPAVKAANSSPAEALKYI